MEFRYRSGEQRDSFSSSSSFFSSSYFAEQALRAGIVPSKMSRTETLIEELRKERIREEILAREIARKRMLEEEMLRELELERRFETRSFEKERFLPLEMESRVRERSEPSFMDKYLEIREKERSPYYRDVRVYGIEKSVGEFEKPLALQRAMVEKLGLDKIPWKSETSGFKGVMDKYIEIREEKRSPCYRDVRVDDTEKSVGAFEKPLALRRAMVEKLGLDKVAWKSETSGSKDNKLSDQKVSDIKRKATMELPRLAQKGWSCSLCHVTATSQKNLNVHLQGKKHKAKESQLTNNKATSNNSNTSSSSFKKDSNVPLDQAKDTEGKKQESKKKWANTVWCDLGKLKCNSPALLDCHLNGKKHTAQMESMKGEGDGDGAGNATTLTAEVVKEVTDQKEKQEEVKAEEDDSKANGEEASKKTLVSSWE